jgi:hypothetical protein
VIWRQDTYIGDTTLITHASSLKQTDIKGVLGFLEDNIYTVFAGLSTVPWHSCGQLLCSFISRLTFIFMRIIICSQKKPLWDTTPTPIPDWQVHHMTKVTILTFKSSAFLMCVVVYHFLLPMRVHFPVDSIRKNMFCALKLFKARQTSDKKINVPGLWISFKVIFSQILRSV